ncbi:hypothetical protein CDL12_01766 [Handroanthus impetiginosus]|uniref:Uncharacterized protein n=1 Tax=Handroanthus impetiginosus TaxID=429701 RepID=A0A2G9I6T5_9LAMI|nr:hypothetical protein CDL12_01766 [Handroanthus impetiginosus]
MWYNIYCSSDNEIALLQRAMEMRSSYQRILYMQRESYRMEHLQRIEERLHRLNREIRQRILDLNAYMRDAWRYFVRRMQRILEQIRRMNRESLHGMNRERRRRILSIVAYFRDTGRHFIQRMQRIQEQMVHLTIHFMVEMRSIEEMIEEMIRDYAVGDTVYGNLGVGPMRDPSAVPREPTHGDFIEPQGVEMFGREIGQEAELAIRWEEVFEALARLDNEVDDGGDWARLDFNEEDTESCITVEND